VAPKKNDHKKVVIKNKSKNKKQQTKEEPEVKKRAKLISVMQSINLTH